jgi:hypothetical protein
VGVDRAASKFRKSLRGFRSTFTKEGEAAEKTPEQIAIEEARKEALAEEARKKEEERKRKEIEEKDLADRQRVKECLDKWKVSKNSTVLDLTAKNFLDEEIEVIGMALKYDDTYAFDTCILSRCFIGCAEIKVILDVGMKMNRTLTSLDLSSSKLGDEGCKSLQYSLIKNTTLTALDCRNCSEISDLGAHRLLSLVKYVEMPEYLQQLANPDESTRLKNYLSNSKQGPDDCRVHPIIVHGEWASRITEGGWLQIEDLDALVHDKDDEAAGVDAAAALDAAVVKQGEENEGEENEETEKKKARRSLFKSSVGRTKGFRSFGRKSFQKEKEKDNNEKDETTKEGDDNNSTASVSPKASPRGSSVRSPSKSWMKMKSIVKIGTPTATASDENRDVADDKSETSEAGSTSAAETPSAASMPKKRGNSFGFLKKKKKTDSDLPTPTNKEAITGSANLLTSPPPPNPKSVHELKLTLKDTTKFTTGDSSVTHKGSDSMSSSEEDMADKLADNFMAKLGIDTTAISPKSQTTSLKPENAETPKSILRKSFQSTPDKSESTNDSPSKRKLPVFVKDETLFDDQKSPVKSPNTAPGGRGRGVSFGTDHGESGQRDTAPPPDLKIALPPTEEQAPGPSQDDSRRAKSFATFGGVSKVRSKFRQSLNKVKALSPKATSTPSTPSNNPQDSGDSATPKKDGDEDGEKKGGWGTLKKKTFRGSFGLKGLTGGGSGRKERQTEHLHGDHTSISIADLIEEAKKETVKLKELDEVEKATKPLCPTITTLCGLPVEKLLGDEFEDLNLSDMKLAYVESYLLSYLLEDLTKVTSLDLSKNKFKTASFKKLRKSIAGLSLLTTLNVSNNMLFKSGASVIADILGDCLQVERLLVNEVELTNSVDLPLIVRKGKEAAVDIIPDMLSALKLKSKMEMHKRLVVLDLEGNGIEPHILAGILNRLKVNRALLHTKSHFEEFVDTKYDLKNEKNKREKKDHKTNVTVDYDYFDREKVPIKEHDILDGESRFQRIAREAREKEEREEAEERAKEGEAQRLAAERRAELGEELQELTSEEKAAKEAKESELERKKQRQKRKTKAFKAQEGGAMHWDDTPNVYHLNDVPVELEIAPATPHSRHVDRLDRLKKFPPPGRCGSCIGCMALLRCENQGAYKRTDEAIDLIRGGLLERGGDNALKDALAVIRSKRDAAGGEKKNAVKVNEEGKVGKMKRRGSVNFGRRSSNAGTVGLAGVR